MRFLAVVNVLSRVMLLFAASMALPWALSYAIHDGAQAAFGYSLAATLIAGLALWLATFQERRELQVRDGFLLVALVWTVLPGFAALPWVLSYAIHDGAQGAFGYSLAATLIAGLALWLATFQERRELQVRDGFLLVALVWTVLPGFAALPLMLSIDGLAFTDAYFEAVSGLTASGATVPEGLDRLPGSGDIWRGLLIGMGGRGVIVLAVAILPLLGVGGSQLFKAETPTPMKDTKLTPRIAETAKGLWLVYVGFTAACTLAYWLAGMDGFDALMHGFTTMGLGGFSSHDASYAYWNSPAIEAVAIVFMLVAAMNFASHFLAWRRLSARPYARD